MLLVFNATCNNILVYNISWQLFLLMDEARENHRPDVNHRQFLSNNVLSNS